MKVESLISKYSAPFYFLAGAAIFILYTLPNANAKTDPTGWFLFAVFSCLGIISFFLSEKNRVNLFLLFFSTFFSLIVAESAGNFLKELKANKAPRERETKIKELGVKYDRRSAIEIIDDLKNNDIKGYAAFLPTKQVNTNLEINKEKPGPFLLGSISLKTTLFCNESGKMTIYQSDEHGFNNPAGVWNQPVDLMLIGDSFTQGACVAPEESIASVLRRKGHRVISLGSGGNGPLIELATLTEYVLPMRPKIVLWIYFEGNDLFDLVAESKNPILTKYYDGNFTQNLISIQPEIDRLIEADNKKWEQDQRMQSLHPVKPTFGDHLRNILEFNTIKGLFGGSFRAKTGDDEALAVPKLKHIISLAKERSEIIGAKFIFVYLPRFERGKSASPTLYNREKVLAAVRELNVPIIDIFEEVQSKQPDFRSLYPYGLTGHYTAQGYSLVAEAIDAALPQIKDDRGSGGNGIDLPRKTQR